MVVETSGGLMELRIQEHNEVEVVLGPPRLTPAEIPFRRDEQQEAYRLLVDNEELEIGAVSMGNPHAVLRVPSVDDGSLERLGPLLEAHPDFPERANAGFLEVLGQSEARLRVYERGVGETQACGSGACAAVVYGHLRGWFGTRVAVELPGGKLQVEWHGGDSPVVLRGPTAISFEGSLRL